MREYGNLDIHTKDIFYGNFARIFRKTLVLGDILRVKVSKTQILKKIAKIVQFQVLLSVLGSRGGIYKILKIEKKICTRLGLFL